MIYSCFNEKAGHYEYFEDSRALAMNGDFPVPQIQKLQAGRVGVPARDAGRSLPRDAKRVGTGWHARGAIVQCKNTPMRGLSGFGVVNGLGFFSTGDLALIALFFSGMGAGIGALASYVAGGDVTKGAVWSGVATVPAITLILGFHDTREATSEYAFPFALACAGAVGVYAGGGAKRIEGVLTAALAAAGLTLINKRRDAQ
jgi:hypothetical protein